LGVLGITANELAQIYNRKADLLIIAGASFGERTSYNWNNELIKERKSFHIDNNYEQLNKVSPPISLVAEVRQIFDLLNSARMRSDRKIREVLQYKAKYLNRDARDRFTHQ
jgi:thiamine pyrophosphate-dependent acetolactate synthase large subunit-like protein